MRGHGAKAIAALGGCLLGAALLLDCNIGRECNAVGCGPAATLTAHFPVAPATFDDAVFTLCLNGKCSTGGYPQMIGDLGEQRVDLNSDGPSDVDVVFEFYPDTYLADGNEIIFPVHDGDVYEVKIVAADATKLDQTRSATYSVSQPNGTECAPTCHEATLSVTP